MYAGVFGGGRKAVLRRGLLLGTPAKESLSGDMKNGPCFSKYAIPKLAKH